ncbi:cytochrome P450, putative [Talaromyces stipitatus ATCC 10500]|uniref:Cytochrome P450, putative n=1 Tax=Talaromyces stipitatus (strain ATCC 10500 / CBS 375.48 / QM 6759 / NRRL 1006) TaxID=441959 RepID=B8M063_TALSN|nr:cytochrome P450, putative [Talaromyces stipitatus ATCC 10500]EED21160.1 cytochrome P450, putative [Talaromyces stipitatus ATCC 10500]
MIVLPEVAQNLPFPHLLLAILSVIVTATAARIIYNLYFHPLHSYPGPLLGRATILYPILCELRGSLHLKVKEWHDEYGEVVRVAPNQLLYNSGRAWEKICGHRTSSNQSLFDKDQTFFFESPQGKHTMIGENGEKHRRLRRLLAHAFSDRALRAQEDILQSYVESLISQLRKRAATFDTNTVDMMRWFNYITFDIIGDLSFGDSFGLLEKGIWQRYLSSIFGLLQFGVRYRAIKRTFPLSWRFFLARWITPKDMREDRLYQHDLAQSKLTKRVSVDTGRQDFVHYMLKGSKDAIGPDGLSMDEIVNLSEFLMLAGSETTATVLSGMLYHLLQNPQCLSRLTSEIRSSFKSENDINLNSAAQLRYLHAVLEESMRIYPPVPNSLPRVTPEPGQIICDKFVPAGTSVGLHHYSSYHSSDNFFEPDAFHPERWLEGEDPRFRSDRKDAFHPFSHGPRNCLGKK